MADSKLSDLPATSSPATTDILYIVTDPAGTPADKKVTVGDLRGASGDTALRTQTGPLWTPPGSLNALTDEFDDGSIRANWVTVDYGNATAVTWQENSDLAALSLRHAGGDAVQGFHAKMLPLGALSAPVEVETVVDYIIRAGTWDVGLVFADGTTAGSGKQLSTGFLTTGGNPATYIRNWTGYNTYVSDTLGTQTVTPLGARIWLRFAWVAANTWRARMSIDGKQWLSVNLSSTQTDSSFTMTPTHVGVWASSYGSGANVGGLFTFHHFRVRTTATA